MDQQSAYHALSPLDGRYYNSTQSLRAYFSEAAFIRYRLRMEVEYFIALMEMPLPGFYQSFIKPDANSLRALYDESGDRAVNRIKAIEKTTNHDVKAI